MRHAVNGSILGMLLLAASPAAAQSMVELGAAMGVNGALNRTGAGSATTALKARETIASHAPSGSRGWHDGGDSHGGSAAGVGKGWATASSGSGSASGKSGWATPGSSSSSGGAGGKCWASKGSGGGAAVKGWAGKKAAGAPPARASAATGGGGPSARDLATSRRSSP